MASDAITQFTDANFEAEVMKSNTPVLVDITADWCPPCKRLAPTIEKLAGDYANRVKVGKLDADANHDTVIKFAVSALPTVLIIKSGQVTRKFVGLRKEEELRQALDAAL